ncbi:helix-turn-helix transcriptional regulator [Cohnella silvisoli]|uniref:YafY family protein n=1 Tax=Cohnella silvisoli TaxID=2873699 RepID=A0ABV1KTF4_9BACL|nr:YafY family protein [Cohnella silvisoli]MCD9021422.1 YafY family transcriptional regulator [Cohnella silvisoli]
MKLDRLLAITMALLNQTRVSATELAERFEVSLRTIYRDMESINQSGIPIVSFPGSDGGYEIMSGYRLDKQILSLEDFSSICMALRGVKSATDNPDIDGLLERIGALMPNKPDQLDTSAKLNMEFATSQSEKNKISTLHRATKDQHIVTFEYIDIKGTETERKIEPHGLFLRGYAWYVYGYCLTRFEPRVFRLSRIIQLKEHPEKFESRNITLQDIEQRFVSQADFTKISVVLCFNTAVKTRVRDEFDINLIKENTDGTLQVTTQYSSIERAVQHALSYSFNVRIVEPPELVAEVQRHILSMNEIYKS